MPEVSTPSCSWPNPAVEPIDRLEGSVRISKQLHRKVEGIELIRLKREQRNQDLCFSSRRFVLCGLPVRRLPVDQQRLQLPAIKN
jgi:hypothetical protein